MSNQIFAKKKLSVKNLIVFIFAALFSMQCLANLATPQGRQEHTPTTPSITTCSKGSDFGSHETKYVVQDLKGPLPVIRSYMTTLAFDFERERSLISGADSLGGWTNNYDGYMTVIQHGNADGHRLRFELLLPGQKYKTYYVGYLSAGKISSVKRAYSSLADHYSYAMTTTNLCAECYDKAGYFSEEHQDLQLSVLNASSLNFITDTLASKKLIFEINNYGDIYTFVYKFSSSDPADQKFVYKLIKKRTVEGAYIGYSYRSDYPSNISVVSDNRGNTLTFDYYEGVDLDSDEYGRKLIKSITAKSRPVLNPQTGLLYSAPVQTVEYTYQSFGWTDFISGVRRTINVIASVKSPTLIRESYTYLSLLQSTTRRDYNTQLTAPEYRVPILESVFNDLGVETKKWGYGVDRQGWSFLSSTALVGDKGYENKVEIAAPVTNSTAVDRNTTYYNMTEGYKLYGSSGYGGLLGSQSYKANFRNDLPIIEYSDFSGLDCVKVDGKPVSYIKMNYLKSQISSFKNAKGVETQIEYDAKGRVIRSTEANNLPEMRVTTYTYGDNNFNTPISIIRSSERIDQKIDSYGRVFEIHRYPGKSAGHEYEYFTYYNDPNLPNFGKVKTYVGPRSEVITYNYDGNGNLSSKSYTLATGINGVKTQVTEKYANYNWSGDPGLYVDVNGTQHESYYDEFDRLFLSQSKPVNSSDWILNKYVIYINLVRNPFFEVDSDGVVTNFTWDRLDRIIRSNRNGASTAYVYDDQGNLKQRYQYDGEVANGAVNYESCNLSKFDTSNRLLESGNCGENPTVYSYNIAGELVSITRPREVPNQFAVEKYTYDNLGRIKTFTDSEGGIHTKSYRVDDDLLNHQTPNLSNFNFEYAAPGMISSSQISGILSKRNNYDPAGNFRKVWQGYRTCDFVFDDGNRPISKSCTANSVDPLDVARYSYSYDPLKPMNLAEVLAKNLTSVTKFGYDIYGRVSEKSQLSQLSTSSPKLKVAYTYTIGGRLTRMVLPSGRAVDYQLYAQVDNTGGRQSLPQTIMIGGMQISSLKYNSFGGLKYAEFSNGIVLDHIINSGSMTVATNGLTGSPVGVAGQLNRTVVQSNNVNLATFGYTYGLNGKLVSEAISSTTYPATQQSWQYTYSPVGRLIGEKSVLNRKYQRSFEYDVNGNRRNYRHAILDSDTASKYYKNMAIDHLYRPGTDVLASSRYNNSLSVVTEVANEYGEFVEDVVQDGYLRVQYDALGRRVQEVYADRTDEVITFEYNYKNERIAKISSIPANSRLYMYDESSHLIGEYTTSGASVVEYVWIDDLPIAAIKGDGTALALVTDRLGTLRRAYDANRSMVFSWDPDAFGVNKAFDTTGVLKLRFPGQVYDDRSGLHYNLNRYYSPWLGRYLEPDPLGLTAGSNPYVYANNDPLNTIDRDGLCPVCIFEGAAFVAMRVAPVVGRYVYLNAPRIAGFIEGLSPAAAGSVSSAVALEARVANGAKGRVFTSSDPLVGDVATKIDAAYPGHVVGVNVPIRDASGRLVTDADILLKNAVIQVKSGGGKGLTSQVQRTEQATGLPTIGYGPDLKPSIVKGCTATTCLKTLIDVVKP